MERIMKPLPLHLTLKVLPDHIVFMRGDVQQRGERGNKVFINAMEYSEYVKELLIRSRKEMGEGKGGGEIIQAKSLYKREEESQVVNG